MQRSWVSPVRYRMGAIPIRSFNAIREGLMKSRGMLAIVLGFVGARAVLCQAPPPGLRSGPGVQAAQDAREPEVLKGCRTSPPAASGPGRGRAPANAARGT